MMFEKDCQCGHCIHNHCRNCATDTYQCTWENCNCDLGKELEK